MLVTTRKGLQGSSENHRLTKKANIDKHRQSEHTEVEQLGSLCIADGNGDGGCEKQDGGSLKTLKAELLYDAVIPLLDMLKRSEIRISG